MIELWFLFSLIWSIGATVDENIRKKLDMFLREIEGQFPRKYTVFEYYVDPIKRGWSLWEEKVCCSESADGTKFSFYRFPHNGDTPQILRFTKY